MMAAFTTEKNAAFPYADGASKIKLRPLLSAFRAGKAFKPGAGIGIRKLVQSVFGADGEAVPAAGARGCIDILSVRTFRLDADEKILFTTDGTGNGAQPFLYGLLSDHSFPSIS